MAIYLEYEGIKGSVTEAGFKDQWAIDNLNFGINRNVAMRAGDLSNRETGVASMSEISFTKLLDDSAAVVFKEACGAIGKKVKISVCKTVDNKTKTYLVYELENCVISSYGVNLGAEDEAPHENISLSFSKIQISYTKHDTKGAAGSPQRAHFDVSTGARG